MLRRYGGIYFFRPYEAQKPILLDTAASIYVHGNNSSGKSYIAAACTAYQFVGWHPEDDPTKPVLVKPPKYGDRLIWAFSPSFDLQRTSSQVHLFATDSPGSIGLLPSLDVIQQFGGRVVWGKRTGCLDFIEIPASWGTHRTILEFKSGEMQEKNLQASGLDWNWFDEYVPVGHHDEVVARLMRKNGRLIMSFILRPDELADSYITKDLYTAFTKKTKEDLSFHFLSVGDNESLSEDEINTQLGRYVDKSKTWRFASGGFFNLEPVGEKVFHNYNDDFHRITGLTKTVFEERRPLYMSWDLGYAHPVCIAAQVDGSNRLNILFAKMGTNQTIINFIDEIEAHTKLLLPDCLGLHDIIPHDGRRHSDKVSYTTEDVFKNSKRGRLAVTYTKRDTGFELCNEELGKWVNSVPKVRFDYDHAEDLCHTLRVYINDEKTGKPLEDNYHEHYADAFKQLVVYLCRKQDEQSDDLRYKRPMYFNDPPRLNESTIGRQHGFTH